MATSYVFENTEVVLTGRRAERELPARGRRGKASVSELVEIKPKDTEDGSWKKFVKMTDLYKIVE